jgi:hypothetical protein
MGSDATEDDVSLEGRGLGRSASGGTVCGDTLALFER